ncbi:MAG: DUF6371 domain-containing protein [Prevotella sp.]|nr:DUF6371 domain-containing protein [Prevotella sp.]
MNSNFEHFDTHRLNAISIVEVAQRLGQTWKAGTLYKTHCPWHDDSHPSLVLYRRTDENRCHCFACGKGGSVIDYVMQHEHWTFQEACQWLSQEYGISTTQAYYFTPRPRQKVREAPAEPVYTYIPMAMLDDLVSVENSLCKCLMHMFLPEAVKWFTEEYRIGSYAMGNIDDYTVFPSIDQQGRLCNLKVQHYETDLSSTRFAHSDADSCRWLGAIWAREGKLPADACFCSSCLFGEHLLARYPNSMVALVESPKNALFGALAFPQMVWVAAGNKSMLSRKHLQPLRHRNVIVIPDCDAVDEWTESIGLMKDLANFTVSDFCQRMAPSDEPKFDIADYLQQRWVSPPF